jgi:dipeptidyl aminopeptidase/acylaminoacyl peptidase
MNRMIVLFVMMALVLSCEKTTEKKDQFRPVYVVAERQQGGVRLAWYDPFMWYKNYIIAPGGPAPEAYEILLSKGDPGHLVKIALVSRDDSASYRITGLTAGECYYAAVNSVGHEGFPAMSNTVMFIPSTNPGLKPLAANPSIPMELGSMATDGQTIAYVNRSFTWGNGMYGAMALFTVDRSTHVAGIVDTMASFPDWSPAAMQLVYCTDEHEQAVNYRRPQQLALYDRETSQTTLLTQGNWFNGNPEFSPDGEWIVYTSDEGHQDVFEIWKMKRDGSQKTQLTQGSNLSGNNYGNIGLGRPSWSGDGTSVYFSRMSENSAEDGIFRIPAGGGAPVAVIQSRWLDFASAVSPDNTKLAFFSNRSGYDQVWLYDLETEEYSQVTGQPDIYISPNWNKIEWLSNSALMFGAYLSVNNQYQLYEVEVE